MSNSLDPDQARHFVGPDLGPNCLQRLSADCETTKVAASKKTVKYCNNLVVLFFVCFDALCPSQQLFSHVRTISCLPGLN